MGKWFFTKDILARLERGDHYLLVRRWRRGHRDKLDFRVVDQLSGGAIAASDLVSVTEILSPAAAIAEASSRAMMPVPIIPTFTTRLLVTSLRRLGRSADKARYKLEGRILRTPLRR